MTVAEFIEDKIVASLIRKADAERLNPESKAFQRLLEIRTGEVQLVSTKVNEKHILDLEVLDSRCCRGESGSFYRLQCRGRIEVGYYPRASHGAFACIIDQAAPNSCYRDYSYRRKAGA